jgi:putative transposase
LGGSRPRLPREIMVIRKRLDIEMPGLAFVTTTVTDWQPIFLNENIANMALNQLSETTRFYNVSIVAYCLMPSHLHAILNMENIRILSNIIGSFKSLSSRKIKHQFPDSITGLLDSKGLFQFWKPRFDDFIIRDMEQLRVKMNYIHENPVRAKLVENATDWKYSSASDWVLSEKGIIEVDKNIFG